MKLYIRHQPRYNQYYIVNGYTPVRLAGHPMFFPTKSAALDAARSRGWEAKNATSEELVKVEVSA